MSNGFRFFLLIVLGFGAVWIHRFRAPELELLLNPPRPVFGNLDASEPLVVDRAVGSLGPPIRTGWEHLASTDWRGVESWSPGVALAEEGHQGRGHAPTEPDILQPDPDLVTGAFEEDADSLSPAAFEQGDESVQFAAGEPPVEEFPAEESTSEESIAERPLEPTREEERSGPRTIEIDYVVEKNDNLWTVAKKFLGKGHRYPEIMELNSLSSETLVPGTRLRLRVPADRAPEENLKSEPPPDDKSVEASSGLRQDSLSHKVKARETLSQIASMYFPGDPEGVSVLFEANRDRLSLSSPDEIREGQILVIPTRR